MKLTRKTLRRGERTEVHDTETGIPKYRVWVLGFEHGRVVLGFEEPVSAVKVVHCDPTDSPSGDRLASCT